MTEKTKSAVESRCGCLCSSCRFQIELGCRGCLNIEKPVWGDSCPLKSCCEEKGLVHCGECSEFVCPALHAFAYDMEYSDRGARLERCKEWLMQK
ncbi:MAG TPA: DUF3795 domain-containing protein [Methanocorpusculum sp.]|nr:DUF3795 domain-containing protein [Methanocorpusculum sp.]